MKAEISMAELIMFVGVLLVGFVIMIIVAGMAGSGAQAQLAIEHSTISYYITASANALSLAEEGSVEMDLKGTYDISVSASDTGPVLLISYLDQGSGEHEVVTSFFAGVAETSLQSVDSLCISKQAGTEQVEVREEC